MLSMREIQILDILHRQDVPMTATEAVNRGEGLTQSTATAVLRNLLREGLVETTGVVHSGKVLSRTYRSTPRAKDALMDGLLEHYAMASAAVPAEELCARIMETAGEGRP